MFNFFNEWGIGIGQNKRQFDPNGNGHKKGEMWTHEAQPEAL